MFQMAVLHSFAVTGPDCEGPSMLSAVEVRATVHSGDDVVADQEVSEPLTRLAVLPIAPEHGLQPLKDGALVHVDENRLVQPLAEEAAAEIEIVRSWTAAAERDLGDIRPGAAIVAAADANGDRLFVEATGIDDVLQLADEVRQKA